MRKKIQLYTCALKIKTLELLIAMAMVYDVMKIMLHFSGHKPSYSSSPVVWIRQASLQSDIQKVLRHARKMPEKTPHFYKELNRIRKAALSIGFYELMDGVASIFEKECAILPGK